MHRSNYSTPKLLLYTLTSTDYILSSREEGRHLSCAEEEMLFSQERMLPYKVASADHTLPSTSKPHPSYAR